MDSTVGYSQRDNDNTDGQAPNAFKKASTRSRTATTDLGVSGRRSMGRQNSPDGFTSDDIQIQFSAKYNFSVVRRQR